MKIKDHRPACWFGYDHIPTEKMQFLHLETTQTSGGNLVSTVRGPEAIAKSSVRAKDLNFEDEDQIDCYEAPEISNQIKSNNLMVHEALNKGS